MEGRILDFVALGILIGVIIVIIYAVIYIHDIPYNIAKKRNHPHTHAIHTAGYVSLFLMHALWPFLWIWATLWVPEKGWGMSSQSRSKPESDIPVEQHPAYLALQARVVALEEKLNTAPPKKKSKAVPKEA